MYTRLILLGVFAVVACTGNNPAFESSAGSQAEATSVADSEDTVGVESGEEGQPLVCELSGGEPMVISMAPQCAQDDLEAYDRWFSVLSVDGSTWWVGACTDPNCGGCEAQTQLPLSFDPIPVGDLAGVDSCLRVAARRRNPTNPDSCSYHTAVVWEYTNGVGRPILIARNDSAVAFPAIDPAAGPMLAAFEPTFMPAASCPCDDYPDDCCDGQGPAPTVFNLDIALGNTVALGDTGTVMLDEINYEFWALDAFDSGVCDEPRHVSWALTRAL